MSDKVRVICKFPKGITLQRVNLSAALAYDGVTGQTEPRHTYFHLNPGINENVDFERIRRWTRLAEDQGLRFDKSADGSYIISDGRPKNANELIIFRAMASDRVVRAG